MYHKHLNNCITYIKDKMVVRIGSVGQYGGEEEYTPTPVISQQPSIFPSGTTARGPVTIISSGGVAVAVSPEDLSRKEAIRILEAGEGIQVGKLTFRGEPKEVAEPTGRLEYETTQRMGGETSGEYQARIMREEIAFRREQPYEQVGPTRLYREYGVLPSEQKIEGYEDYQRERPMSKFATFYSSKVKAPIARTFFPDVREVREAERLGIDVAPKQKFRAEVQKFIPAFIVGAGVGAVAGAGMALLPSAVQAMKIRQALILGVPAGVGIYKGIKAKEYGMVAGGVLGGIKGYGKGYEFGRTKLRPAIVSRMKPVEITGLAETVLRKLPEGETYIAGTKARFQAKVGKQIYTGNIDYL